MTAPACTIDVLTGRKAARKPRPQCAWGDCHRLPARNGQFPCPAYCKRHCLEAERSHGHDCERARHRAASRHFMQRKRGMAA